MRYNFKFPIKKSEQFKLYMYWLLYSIDYRNKLVIFASFSAHCKSKNDLCLRVLTCLLAASHSSSSIKTTHYGSYWFWYFEIVQNHIKSCRLILNDGSSRVIKRLNFSWCHVFINRIEFEVFLSVWNTRVM